MTTTNMHPIRECEDDIAMMMMSNNSDDTTAPLNLPTPTDANAKERMDQIDRLKLFLATAPENWEDGMIKRFRLPTGEDMSCVLWDDLFYITGTDIVRSLTFRFHAFGRPVSNPKKFEEGIFSDLRNLKPGTDARLEEPKSELLDMLYKNNCIRTQKKQKVFYWYSVPHDRLFLDALERDLKREKMDLEPTTIAVAEPAASISLDSTQELFDQLRKNMSLSAAATAHALEDEAARCAIPQQAMPIGYWNGWMARCVNATNRSAAVAQASQVVPTSPTRRPRVNSISRTTQQPMRRQQPAPSRHHFHHLSHAASHAAPPRPSRIRQRTVSATSALPLTPTPGSPRAAGTGTISRPKTSIGAGTAPKPLSPMARAPGRGDTRRASDVSSSKSLDSNALKKKKAIFGTLSLFDGSPTYKQRRRRAASTSSALASSQYNASSRRVPVLETPPPGRRVSTPSTPSSLAPGGASTAPGTACYLPSRLAMTAVAAGYTIDNAPTSTASSARSPSPIATEFDVVAAAAATAATVEGPAVLSVPVPTTASTATTLDWTSPVATVTAAEAIEPERAYTCTQRGHLFKHLDSFDRHLHSHKMACADSLIKEQNIFQDGVLDGHSMARDDASPKLHMLAHEDQHQHNGQDNCGCDRPSSLTTDLNNNSWPQTAMATAAVTTAGGSLCSSRCSTLSPTLDLDFGMQQQQHYQQQQSIQTLNRSRTSSTSEDDSSSSSLTSSPSIHLGYSSHLFSMQHQMLPTPPLGPPDACRWMKTVEEDSHSYYPRLPTTLVMPFKPDLYQHHDYHPQHQQFLQSIQDSNAYLTAATAHYSNQDTMLMPYDTTASDELMYQLQDTATVSSIPYSSPFVMPMDMSMTMMH
ncbi:STE like transcription factor-domain-containing protein [Dichotomocladium elegans]|nr:STE like transcription factor-domain-containing protein [Dichotomocladium elegans]